MDGVSGSGGPLGGPQQPTVYDWQQRGIEDTQKAQLALVKDTVEIPLTQLGGGAEEVYEQYKASASRPVLAPLAQLRMGSAEDAPETQDTTGIYQNLLSRLPTALANGLEENQALPAQEQNLSFVALDNLLSSTAQVLTSLESAALPPAAGTLASDRLENAQTAPYQAVLSALNLNQELSSSLQSMLSEAGPNDPNYDTLQNALSEMETFSSALTALSQQQTVYSGDLVQISTGLQNIQETLQRDLRENSYQILGNSMEALSTITSAYSLGSVAPSNLLSLLIVDKGLSGENGVYSDNFASLIDTTASGLQNVLNLDNQTQIQSLNLMLSTLALASVSAGSTLGNGVGQFPDRSEGDMNAATRFSTDLAVSFLVSSGAIETVIGELVSTTGVEQNAAEPLTSALTLWSLTLGIQAAGTLGKSQANDLIESLQPQLLNHLNTLDQYITNQQESGELSKEVGQGALVYLSQASIALQNQDYEAFSSSLESLLQLTGQSGDSLKKEIVSITEFSSLAGAALAGKLDDQLTNLTGISQV
ncbi:hypothetical protein [Parachlamydia sp. AcF125]|uniref:hypothetical protein n=1 Tax=Parachlamydia sp. AcF125 TaxID=2795736 RepID=UPI001BC98973|nr:hypothetical protein [Parachlamydia sp. AcF125]MBS4168097.1 hypothetical protein [Parachlamydia sp. AcF125]